MIRAYINATTKVVTRAVISGAGYFNRYLNRIKIDGGTIENANNTSAYISMLNTNGLYKDSRVIYFGDGAYKKRISTNKTYISKAYSLDKNDNDLTQTTEASQPFTSNIMTGIDGKCGLFNSTSRKIVHNAITYTDTDAWSVCVVVNNVGGAATSNKICGKSDSTTSSIRISAIDRRFVINPESGSDGVGTVGTITNIVGCNTVFHFVASGNGTLKIYENAILIDTISVVTNFQFDSLFSHSTAFFLGNIFVYRLQNGIMSTGAILNEKQYLSTVYDIAETVNIDGIDTAINNLNIRNLISGTSLVNKSTVVSWITGTAGYCHHQSSTTLNSPLYNKAARDLIIAAPIPGYHIATEAELTSIALNGGSALKTITTGENGFWNNYEGVTNTNATKFCATGSGSRNADGSYNDIYLTGSFWCSDSDKVLKVSYLDGTAELIAADPKEGHAIRLVKDLGFEMLGIVPPTVPGDNNNHAIFADLGGDDTMYFFGMSDKRGRVYKSTDGGVTLSQIVDLKDEFSLSTRPGVWAVRVLPNNELLVNSTETITVDGLDEHHTFVYISSGGQTVWNYAQKDIGGNFEMTYYNEKTEGVITFEVYGKLIDGWGFDVYGNMILMTEYGYMGAGTTSAYPYKNSVGHMITGKVWLSEDYGVTFKQIFDYQNPPANIIRVTVPQMHHSHGCFFDTYTITNGKPRLIAMMGDAEARLIWSDDLGLTWTDNKYILPLNGYNNTVAGIATLEGYFFGTDASVINGVEFVSRNFIASERFSVLRLFDNYGTDITYVGVNFYKRENSIASAFTPETGGRYASGARGCIILSEDNGITWRKIYTDSIGIFNSITAGRIVIDSNGTLLLKPAGWVQDLDDGLGLCGRLIKITI